MMPGQLTVPYGSLVGAVTYARALGCTVSAACVTSQGALHAIHTAGQRLTGSVRGWLVKRTGGPAFARELGLEVIAIRRRRSYEVDCVVPAGRLPLLAREQASGVLTFAPLETDGFDLGLRPEQVAALRWVMGAVCGTTLASGGYGMLVARELLVAHRGGAVRAESNAA